MAHVHPFFVSLHEVVGRHVLAGASDVNPLNNNLGSSENERNEEACFTSVLKLGAEDFRNTFQR